MFFSLTNVFKCRTSYFLIVIVSFGYCVVLFDMWCFCNLIFVLHFILLEYLFSYVHLFYLTHSMLHLLIDT